MRKIIDKQGGIPKNPKSPDALTAFDPQETRRNSFSAAIKELVSGPFITDESKARRKILNEIGRNIEQFIQRILKDRSICIAIIPYGSTLKGYASHDSDIELSIVIVEGKFTDDIPDHTNSEVFSYASRLISEKGYKPSRSIR